MRYQRFLLLLLGLNLATTSHSDVVVGQTFLAPNTDPTEGSTAWALTSHGISQNLFTVNQAGEIVGQVANSANKVSEFVWDVTLKPNYKFSDGTPVTAQHVAECLTELNKLNPSASASLGDMTVTPQSDSVVRIESERGTHVMDAVLAEWVFVIYYVNDDGERIFTGPFAVKAFEDGDYIYLVPNEYYDDQVSRRPNIKIQKFADGHALAESVEDHNVDIGFHLPIDTLTSLRDTDGVSIKSFEVGYHYMAFHNTLNPNMADVRVRKAIDVAIDRNALSQSLAGGHGTRSLFPDFSPYFSDDSNPHGDPTEAKQLLYDAGWRLGSNGKRSKDGVELTINLVAYPHRPGLVIMQPVIAKMLTDVGFTVNEILTGEDWDETQKIIDDGSFDILMWAQHTLPAGDPVWFLNAFFRSDGGKNMAGLDSNEVDSLLDALSNAEAHTDRVEACATAQAAILESVPVSNLVTPFWHVGLSSRMAEYEPWGSDYYVIRDDFFPIEIDIPLVQIDNDQDLKFDHDVSTMSGAPALKTMIIFLLTAFGALVNIIV